MLISVAVPVPQLDLLTYRMPSDSVTPEIGARVVVPLGPRAVTGIVVAVDVLATGVEESEIKPIRQLLDARSFIPPHVVELARWTAEYYAAGAGETITAVLPPKTRGDRVSGHKTLRVAAITAAGVEALALPPSLKRRRTAIAERAEAGRQAHGERSGLSLEPGERSGSSRDPGEPSGSSIDQGRPSDSSHDPAEPSGSSVEPGERSGSSHDPAGPSDSSVEPGERSGSSLDQDRPSDSSLILSLSKDEREPIPAGPSLTPRQRRALEMLAGAPLGIPTPQLAADGFPSDAITRLVSRGLVSLRQDRVDRDPFDAASLAAIPIDAGRQLTLEQASALDRLRRLAGGGFRVALLHGVTGSGKTEIFLRLSAAVRESGRTVLMLVPEIALTPVTASLFRQAFGDRVAILHSGLSDGERHDEWQRIRRGDVDVVVGTRSAVFAPLSRVGLLVVDEEHDGSYKQEESPRYHGRDVAIVRGQREQALVVLASATPSMESYHNAMSGRYERVVMERRVKDRPLAAVTIVDMREEYANAGPDVVLGRALTEAIGVRLERQEQTLVLLNRRGFATAVFCRQCAGTLDCPNCSVSLVVHGEGSVRRARCHYCNYSARVPTVCPLCAGPYLEHSGFGTERVEAEVGRAWPEARVARLDRDSVRRRGALSALLARFRDGELDVLVGTQMIAKGHDFPRVTLVGVVSADVGLGMADFRASERTFQLLTQVAGRAGRGEQRGQAIIQTLYPAHYSIQLACRQDYVAFYERELRFREAMRYPPVVSIINTVVRARTFAGAMEDAAEVAEHLRRSGEDGGWRVLGPAPAPLGKLRGEYRAQLLIKGTNRKRMREAVRAAIEGRSDLQRRVIVDIDPISVL